MFSRRPFNDHPRISIQRQRTHTSASDMTPAVPRRTRIAHVGVAVTSLDAILPFYRDILDLPEIPLDDADGARIAGLAAGDSLVELLEASSSPSAAPASITSVSPSTTSNAHWTAAAPPVSASSMRRPGSAPRASASPSSTRAPPPASSSN
jgi:hypothetical protein